MKEYLVEKRLHISIIVLVVIVLVLALALFYGKAGENGAPKTIGTTNPPVSTDSGTDVVSLANQTLVNSDSGSLTNSGEAAGDTSFFGELRAESQGFGSYKIVGALKGDFKSISVVWQYDGKVDEPYVLKKYIPEKRVFEYYIQPKFKTIQKGENTYIFTGEKANGDKESKDLTINEDHNVILSGKYCILDICIDESKPFTKTGDIITQEISLEEGLGTKTVMDINNSSVTVEEHAMMSTVNTNIFKQNNFFVRYSSTQSCGPFSWKQEILDTGGRVLKNIGPTLGVPENLTIGTKTFTLEDLNNDTSTYIYGTLADNKEMTGIYSKSDTNIGSLFLQEIKKNKDSFPKKYTLSFKEYPQIRFVYSMKESQPERVVYLGTDAAYLKDNIDSKGNLLDLTVSNKILSYYETSRRLVQSADLSKSISTATKDDLPLFRVERLTSDGYYLLYPKDGYVFESFAEMCKPVVYVYHKEPTDLQVSLNLFGKGFYTKLIPGFSTGTTWNIHTKKDGLTVDKNFYDYLYYSVKVKGYVFNKDGWIIRGSEAVSFFEDKLPKLSFKSQEQKDFIDFWKDQIKPESYYFVSFKYNKEMDSLVGLSFDKKPHSIERVLFEGYEIPSLEGKSKFLYSVVRDSFDKRLLKTFHRNPEFDVFEWGGVLKDDENTIIR